MKNGVTGRLVKLAYGAARAYWRVRRPVTVGVQGLVFDSAGRVLLIRHRYGSTDHRFPGGRVRRGEKIVDALRREIGEETGLEVTAAAGDLTLLGVYTNFKHGKTDHISVFVVRSDGWSGTPEPDGFEVSEATFADPEDPPETTSPGTMRRLAELLDDEPISYRW